MPMVELVLLLLFAVALLAFLATRIHLPYPIVLVLGGLALGFVPGLQDIRLEGSQRKCRAVRTAGIELMDPINRD